MKPTPSTSPKEELVEDKPTANEPVVEKATAGEPRQAAGPGFPPMILVLPHECGPEALYALARSGYRYEATGISGRLLFVQDSAVRLGTDQSDDAR